MDGQKTAHIQSGKRIRLERSSGGEHNSQMRMFSVPYVMLILLIAVVVSPIWESGYPWGSDSWGHLHRAAYTQEIMQQDGIIEGFINSAWMTDWYLGDPTRVYYPPMTVWILSMLSVIAGDVVIAYRIFVTAILLVLGTSVYAVGVRWSQNVWASAIGASLAVMAPYTLRTIFSEGNLPRGLATLSLPWLIYYTELTLVNRNASSLFVWMSLLWCFAIVAHVMQAVMFAVIIALFIVFRILGNVYIPVRRGILAILSVVMGGGLAGFYLLPAYGRLELENVPSLPTAKIDIFSIDLSALFTNPQTVEMISIGIVTICFALLITVIVAKEHQKALAIVGILSVILAFGTKGILFLLVPMNQSLLPERFLNASAITFPIIIATIPRFRIRNLWLIIGLILVAIIEFPPAWRVVHMRDAPPAELGIANSLSMHSYEGRIAPLTFPNPTASQIFLMSEVGNHDNISGWALENTPHQDSVRRLLTAVLRSPEYLDRVLSLWNTDYFVTNVENSSLLENIHFIPQNIEGHLQLWKAKEPSNFAQILPDDRMLIVGENATSWLFTFPFASESYTSQLNALSEEYLNKFSVIGLTRMENVENIEPTFEDWIATGNTLIVDLSGMKGIFTQGFSLFDVQAFPVTLQEQAQITWSSDLDNMPSEFFFSSSGWVGASYRGLEQTTATITLNDTDFPLIGYQTIGKGRVWYIGFNLLYWLDITEQKEASKTLTNYLLEDVEVMDSLTLPKLETSDLSKSSTAIEFSYSNDYAVDTILSMTFFPRWEAKIDGQNIDIHNHEHLIMLRLPSGTHKVTLKYKPYTTISYIGLVISLSTIMVTVLVATSFAHSPPLAASDRVHNFVDRLDLQTPSPVFNKDYVICPNCGHKKAVANSPTKTSYPFVSITCQNCGYKQP